MGYNVTVPNYTKKRATKLGFMHTNELFPVPSKPSLKHPIRGYYGNDDRRGRGNQILFASTSFKR